MSRTSFIERYVMPAALKIGGQKHVLSVRDGIILNMPFMLIGSFFLIFAYLPIPGYGELMASVFGDAWRDKMLYPVKATYDIMALLSAFGIAYRLAEKYRTLDQRRAAGGDDWQPGTVCGDCDFAALYRDLSPGGQP